MLLSLMDVVLVVQRAERVNHLVLFYPHSVTILHSLGISTVGIRQIEDLFTSHKTSLPIQKRDQLGIQS